MEFGDLGFIGVFVSFIFVLFLFVSFFACLVPTQTST